MSPDLFHAIMDRAQVEKRFPSVMLSLSAHDCHEIREVIADRDRLRSELDAAHEEIRLSRESEHETMADLVATRAELARVRRNHLRRTIEACGELYRRAIENSERNCPVYPTAERCITINRKVRQFREHQRAELARMGEP